MPFQWFEFCYVSKCHFGRCTLQGVFFCNFRFVLIADICCEEHDLYVLYYVTYLFRKQICSEAIEGGVVYIIEATHRKTEVQNFKQYCVEPGLEMMKLKICGFVMNYVGQQWIWKALVFGFTEILAGLNTVLLQYYRL
jgi:hypothetical protein